VYFTTFNLRFSINERTVLVYVPQESGLNSFIKAPFYHPNIKKGKVIPLQARCGPEGG